MLDGVTAAGAPGAEMSGVSSETARVRGAFPGKLARCDAGQVSVLEERAGGCGTFLSKPAADSISGASAAKRVSSSRCSPRTIKASFCQNI